jgi:sodium pump decarboxylase gamma subunit
MILQGLILMVVGLCMVFFFLSLIVLVMTVCEKIIPRFNHLLPDEQPKTKSTRTIPSASDSSMRASEEKIAVAIAVAIAENKKKKA